MTTSTTTIEKTINLDTPIMTTSRKDLLKSVPTLPLVAPSILAADFCDMGKECNAALAAGADLLHLDVMDGHFVPNLTMGPDLCKAIRNHCPQAYLDVHFMVSNPAMFVQSFADAGADLFTFHLEAALDPQTGFDPLKLVNQIHAAGMNAGLAVNPPTPMASVLPLLPAFDLILVMSIMPGFSGQSFMPEVLANVRTIKANLRPDQRLEMDGGIQPVNAASCIAAGCDILAAASSIYKKNNYAQAISDLRNAKPA